MEYHVKSSWRPESPTSTQHRNFYTCDKRELSARWDHELPECLGCVVGDTIRINTKYYVVLSNQYLLPPDQIETPPVFVAHDILFLEGRGWKVPETVLWPNLQLGSEHHFFRGWRHLAESGDCVPRTKQSLTQESIELADRWFRSIVCIQHKLSGKIHHYTLSPSFLSLSWGLRDYPHRPFLDKGIIREVVKLGASLLSTKETDLDYLREHMHNIALALETATPHQADYIRSWARKLLGE